MKEQNHLIKTCPWQRILSGVVLFSMAALPLRAETAHEKRTAPLFGLLYVVDSGGDGPDVFQGDGQCRTALGTCTLRAAIQETNARNTGQDGIVIQVPLVTLNQALPTITTGISISASQFGAVTVWRSYAVGTPAFRIFDV